MPCGWRGHASEGIDTAAATLYIEGVFTDVRHCLVV